MMFTVVYRRIGSMTGRPNSTGPPLLFRPSFPNHCRHAMLLSSSLQSSNQYVDDQTSKTLYHSSINDTNRIPTTTTNRNRVGNNNILVSPKLTTLNTMPDVPVNALLARRKKSTIEFPSQCTTLNPIPDFHVNALAFRNKSTIELMRAAILFGCGSRLPWLIQHSETIVQYSYRILGTTVTNYILRLSLYDQFCAGADLADMTPTIQQLHSNGITCIFDYAIEEDHNSKPKSKGYSGSNPDVSYDLSVERFQQSIRLAGSFVSTSMEKNVSTTTTCNSHNCVAIKVTALIDPAVLARVSPLVTALRRTTQNDHTDVFNILISSKEDIASKVGSFDTSLIEDDDIVALQRLHERCLRLCDTANTFGISLLFDAEQVRYQPTIDAVVLHLQRRYNRVDYSDYPIVYQTYQCYLKDSMSRLQYDLETSKQHQYHMGIKLVRGAYMESERSIAKKKGQPSPIHDTMNETHDNFHAAIELVLQQYAAATNGRLVELMCATHNQGSIEYAIRSMNALSVDRASTCVSFAQLYGMKDNLTYNLGLHGYRAYKYVPYGDVSIVTPYLLRRAMENSAILGGGDNELQMINQELRRRANVLISNN